MTISHFITKNEPFDDSVGDFFQRIDNEQKLDIVTREHSSAPQHYTNPVSNKQNNESNNNKKEQASNGVFLNRILNEPLVDTYTPLEIMIDDFPREEGLLKKVKDKLFRRAKFSSDNLNQLYFLVFNLIKLDEEHKGSIKLGIPKTIYPSIEEKYVSFHRKRAVLWDSRKDAEFRSKFSEIVSSRDDFYFVVGVDKRYVSMLSLEGYASNSDIELAEKGGVVYITKDLSKPSPLKFALTTPSLIFGANILFNIASGGFTPDYFHSTLDTFFNSILPLGTNSEIIFPTYLVAFVAGVGGYFAAKKKSENKPNNFSMYDTRNLLTAIRIH